MSDILGAGLAFPLRVDARGGLALSHREVDIVEAIRVILSTAPGERPLRPEFGCGVHDHVFAAVDAATVGRIEHDVRAALARWEPRIRVLEIDFDLDRMDRGELLIDIEYQVRATNDVRNLVYPFYLIPEEES